METKINVAEILKDKQKGIKLYADAFGELEYCGISDDKDPRIFVEAKEYTSYVFYNNGKYNKYGEPILFPSKGMRDWHKFSWKKGDILVSNDGGTEIIFHKWYDDTYTNFYGKHYLNSEDENNIKYKEAFLCTTERYSLEDKDSAQTYINTIEERLGGKLNRETLEIETAQPEFKDGDIAFADYGNRQDVFIVSDKTDLSEGYNSFIDLDLRALTLNMGYRMSFFKKDLCKLRLATEEEKQKLFDALAKEGKAWDAEKKAIVNLKTKWNPKPFDKVLVRVSNTHNWEADLFGFKNSDGSYNCISHICNQCIPYEGNEHLLGTTKDVED